MAAENKQIQSYGNNSFMIRQPFDFANRTGRIAFDVDAVSLGSLATYIEIDLTDDPIPAPTFREFQNFEAGPVPRNGLMMKWSDNCASNGGSITLGNILVYTDYAPRTLIPVGGTPCVTTKQGSMNHFEIQVSQQRLDIYGSDHSTDNGQSFPNFRKMYSADLNLAFTRGYVHVSARNHATIKYGFGPDGVSHWDNIGFDGPLVSGLVSGLNTLEMLPLNAPMDYPPAVANIDLTLSPSSGSVLSAPTGLRIVRRAPSSPSTIDASRGGLAAALIYP